MGRIVVHGKRLFGDSGRKALTLAESQIVGEGVAILTYRPAA